MNYVDFKAQWLGKRIDYDNAYYFQCVDLIKLWLNLGFGMSPGAWGNAIDYWRNPNPAILAVFNKVANTPDLVPPQGSIAIFNPVSGNPYGHIAIVDSANQTVLNCLEQNGGYGNGSGTGSDAIRLRNIGYGNVAGFLIPKQINNIGGEDVIKASDVDLVRIITSEEKGWDFDKVHSGFYDPTEMPYWVGRTWPELIRTGWDESEWYRNLKKKNAEIAAGNTITDTQYWFDQTNKLMVTARGRKWGSKEEFNVQVGRPLCSVIGDIFSGPEYDAHQAKVLANAQENNAIKAENVTLKTQNQTLQTDLQACKNLGGGISQTTIGTINETNSIVKDIKIVVNKIWDFLKTIFRGAN